VVVLHTGVIYETGSPDDLVDDAERLRHFESVCRRDLSNLTGLSRSRIGRWALDVLLGSRVGRFAGDMAAFDADLTTQGVMEASQALCARYRGQVVAEGIEHVPTDGPVLLVANHPGMFDTLAIYATVPRPDIRALARPQPLLVLISALAPHLLMLPDEGPSRSGGLREVLRTLRTGGSLLLFPAGHLEPEPTLLDRHGKIAALPDEPLGPWSNGVGTLVKLAARQDVPLQVIPTTISGVLSAATWKHFGPLIRLRPTLRGREDLLAVLQVAFPSLGPTTVRVRYGSPLSAMTLAADGADVEAITGRVREAVLAQLRDARHGLPERSEGSHSPAPA
jgi:1-acyl-sn-glycerol-3-phosphate acyltransferase